MSWVPVILKVCGDENLILQFIKNNSTKNDFTEKDFISLSFTRTVSCDTEDRLLEWGTEQDASPLSRFSHKMVGGKGILEYNFHVYNSLPLKWLNYSKEQYPDLNFEMYKDETY
jgi:hypothetical protein